MPFLCVAATPPLGAPNWPWRTNLGLNSQPQCDATILITMCQLSSRAVAGPLNACVRQAPNSGSDVSAGCSQRRPNVSGWTAPRRPMCADDITPRLVTPLASDVFFFAACATRSQTGSVQLGRHFVSLWAQQNAHPGLPETQWRTPELSARGRAQPCRAR